MITKQITTPTGHICTTKAEKGMLEFLSIGDYGKDMNIKADFLGMDKEIDGVPNGPIMPLEWKWVVTISTQYGCSMGCRFCDVPLVGPGKNATENDLEMQVLEALTLFPDVKATERLNIHYARMGEPTFNPAVLAFSRRLKEVCAERLPGSLIHPVLTTMMPKRNAGLAKFLHQWAEIKNGYFAGDAGLQISLNSTNDEQREYMFNGESRSLEDISALLAWLPKPVGRKYTLNFAWADDYETDGEKCAALFPPEKFMVKITPIHANKRSVENGIKTSGGYEFYAPYRKPEKAFKDAGYDTLIFIPSVDEDRGMITCGNAVLMGREPDNQVTEIKYRNMATL